MGPLVTCRKVVAEYCIHIREVALKLLEAISKSWGLERDYINRALGKQGQHMALNYYPPCPRPELTYGLPGHADPNAITILLQNNNWVSVNPIPYTFIVNIGDQIQVTNPTPTPTLVLDGRPFRQHKVISNDRYKSVVHRAVVNSSRERISIPTFYCPLEDAVMENTGRID
ncbi:hypothetical protein ACSBR1_016717 [Camellia fascicularis]